MVVAFGTVDWTVGGSVVALVVVGICVVVPRSSETLYDGTGGSVVYFHVV